MAVQEETTYAVSCDRCGQGCRQTKDPKIDEEHWAYWARIGGKSGQMWASTMHMICADCTIELDFWFEHVRTPAGRIYNSGLPEMAKRARSAAAIARAKEATGRRGINCECLYLNEHGGGLCPEHGKVS